MSNIKKSRFKLCQSSRSLQSLFIKSHRKISQQKLKEMILELLSKMMAIILSFFPTSEIKRCKMYGNFNLTLN